jgi:hypothetical protein
MGIRAFWASAFALGITLVTACGDNLEPPDDPDQVVDVELETVAPSQVTAGDTINITCTLHQRGMDGEDLATVVPADVKVVDEAKVYRLGSTIQARKVGVIQVSCQLPDRGVVDPSPANVEIIAGAASNVVTTVTPNPVVAGNDISVTCTVYDDYGNLVDGQSPTLSLAPDDNANTIAGLSATMIHSGHYIATCQLPGSQSNNAGFDVLPNLPAAISLSRAPDLPVYAINDVIQILHVITDKYGNEIFDATVTDASTPLVGSGPAIYLGNSTFKYGGEGTNRITVTVDPPTEGGLTVSAYIDVIINSRGPAISCIGDATMLNFTPGATYTVSGNANDANGVKTLTINGSNVSFNSNGDWTFPIATRFGLNFVDITATDNFDEPTTKVCTFLISNRYAATTTPIPDVLSLKLTQPAVDDFNRTNTLGSFGDVLDLIANSQGLKDAVHNALYASNPLKPLACDNQVCVPFIGCACLYSSGVWYNYSQFDGPNTVGLTLVDGGIAAQARLENVHVNLRVWGKVSGIPYDTTGWVNVSYVQVNLTLDTAISGGKPHITVRPNSTSVQVGSISTDFNGVDGWIIDNIVVPLAQNSLRNALASAIQNFIVNNFNATLDGLMSNLDISTLGASFNVPRLAGGGSVPLSFSVGFSSLSTTPSRILFGIGTRFTSSAAPNAFPTLGIPQPPGANLNDMSISSPSNTGLAAHVSVINGALHALWKANYFQATIDGSSLGSSGTTIDLTTRLPPVAFISNANVVQLHLGAADLTVNGNANLPANLAVRLGLEAHASVSLVGNDLVFGSIIIDQIHASTDAVNLSAQGQQSLQTLLQNLAQQLVDQSLNSSLPALPIPGFTIPTSLSVYGLPAGRQLGINSPSLTVAPQHFTLRGQFGIRP